MKFDLRPCTLKDVRWLCEAFHGYGGAGGSATYAFGVYEDGGMVAAFAWQPPPPGAAKAVCPEWPQGVLALSRMVAVPKDRRALKHISKPLMVQMKKLIDRTRWPVLVTYHDEGQGHTGHVYKCSGWTLAGSKRAPTFTDERGVRTSSYCNGKSGVRPLVRGPPTTIHRWEHRVVPVGAEWRYATTHGWRRIAVPGRVWKSGAQAYTYVKEAL